MARLRGKKVRTITVEGPLRRESVDLRLDERGTFLAYYDGECFEAESQAELVEKLRKEAERVQKTTFQRVIVVEFEKQYGGGHHSYYYGSRDIPDDYIRGFRLDFKVCDVSDQPTGDNNRKLVYDVKENDKGVLVRASQKATDTWWTGKITIPFFEERYAKLKEARAGIIGMVAVLDGLLGKKSNPHKLAAAIDGGKLLLPAAK